MCKETKDKEMEASLKKAKEMEAKTDQDLWALIHEGNTYAMYEMADRRFDMRDNPSHRETAYDLWCEAAEKGHACAKLRLRDYFSNCKRAKQILLKENPESHD